MIQVLLGDAKLENTALHVQVATHARRLQLARVQRWHKHSNQLCCGQLPVARRDSRQMNTTTRMRNYCRFKGR